MNAKEQNILAILDNHLILENIIYKNNAIYAVVVNADADADKIVAKLVNTGCGICWQWLEGVNVDSHLALELEFMLATIDTPDTVDSVKTFEKIRKQLDKLEFIILG